MITLEHKEILHDIRKKLNIANFDGKLEDDELTTVESLLQEIEKEYENNS